MSDLERFAARYNIDPGKLTNQRMGQAALRVDVPEHHDFDGKVSVIRIEPYGRFGNTLFSILNALLMRKRLEINCFELPPILGYSQPPKVGIDGIYFKPAETAETITPTLVGQFFEPNGLETLLGRYDALTTTHLIDKYLREIYANLLEQTGLLGPDVALMHFRGGDVFSANIVHGDVIHPDYVQPPATYYLRSFERLADYFGINKAHLVFEDRTNPAVDIVVDELGRRGVPITLQSATLEQDLISILSAQHIIAPYGTFCEAAAILSTALQSYTGFRHLATQRHISYWPQSMTGEILQARNIRTFVVDDPDRSYITPGDWRADDEQLGLIRGYPKHKLRHMEKLGQNRRGLLPTQNTPSTS